MEARWTNWSLSSSSFPSSSCSSDFAVKLNSAFNTSHAKATWSSYRHIFKKRRRKIRYLHKVVLNYLLTPWRRVLLQKLVKKLPAFHGTRRLITALTSVRHLSLSWARPIQSIYPHPTSWRSILILSTHLRLGLPSGLLPSGFPS